MPALKLKAMTKSNFHSLTKTFIWPVVVLIVALGAFYFKPWQQNQQQSISVSATGTAKAVPNIAKISATVETQNPNIDEARKLTDDKVGKIVEAVQALGIPQEDIKTQNIIGGQSYEVQIYPAPPRKPTNQYSLSLEITIRDFKKADQVLSALTQNGAANLYGPNLQVDDQELETAKSQARQNAIDSAQKKARELAAAAGRRVGKVILIKEQGDYAIPGPLYARGGAELIEKAQTIQPGQDEVSINLLVDFSLK